MSFRSGETMDWKACVICQKPTSEPLSCPQAGKRIDAAIVYSHFLKNVREFREVDGLPADFLLTNETTSDILMDNNASWHRHCHQKFNNTKLDRLKTKKRKCETDPTESSISRSKRRSLDTHINQKCIFCETENTLKLHAYSTIAAEISLREMADKMNDTWMIAKISQGDLVAIEAKYHFLCLIRYKNRYRSFLRQNEDKNSNRYATKARAFVELISYIEDSLEEGISVFKLSSLHQMYEDRLGQLGEHITENRTRFKQKVIDKFSDFGVQEQFDGKNIMLVFPDGMREMLSSMKLVSHEEEALLFAKVAKICRDDMFKTENKFSGTFPPQCQEKSVSSTIKHLTSMILYGPDMKGATHYSQHCLTISQMFTHNSKQTHKKETVNKRHSLKREPPLPIYIGLNIHTQTRSKKLIDKLALLGICITYDRVVELEHGLHLDMCKQFEMENLVCPANLKMGIFTIGALDNIDHNLSSTTAQNSFHGTGISVIQFPTEERPGVSRDTSSLRESSEMKVACLPDSYSVVPAVSKPPSTVYLPVATTTEVTGQITDAIVKEDNWIRHASELLESEELVKDDTISWAAYHASQQSDIIEPPAIISMLPLFTEKADTPAMVKHGMDILNSLTDHLNPGQVPVLACDCPIFAVSKYLQWKYPDLYGEERFVIMFGGLHLEKGLWTALGNLLDCSGWTESLTEANVTTAGTADSCLKASHITRTRHCHQVTALALSKLQQEAFRESDTTVGFESWRQDMIKDSPTFQFWDIILRTEIHVLLFIRAHRENNFDLYIESLEGLMFMFFALDHYNYSRWVSVHIRDMKSLPDTVKDELAEHWVVSKSSKRFSRIPLDQVHEQENCKVKGKGGIIGLTENSAALQRWLVSGPEQRRLLEEFENEYLPQEDLDINYHHHEEGLSTQKSFQQQAVSLTKVIGDYGNPFSETCPELLVLHSRNCADEAVIKTVRQIEQIGQERYNSFKVDVLVNRTRAIDNVIKKNSLPLFNSVKRKANPKNLQLVALRNDVSLFGRLYIANQQRDGDPAVFFSHENQLYPPALTVNGKIHHGTKSDLLKCFDTSYDGDAPKSFHSKIFDGAALIHGLSPAGHIMFKDYAENAFIPLIKRELKNASRVDIVWDVYLPSSIKGCTREKRGSGIRVKVGAQTKIPKKWDQFMRDSKNKEELFSYLSQKVIDSDILRDKIVFITDGTTVRSSCTTQTMGECSQEEADTRVVVHLIDAMKNGATTVMIRTVDTDIIVILIGQFFRLCSIYQDIDLWVGFGTGKNYRHYHINSICHRLGEELSYSLPGFHAYSGCDTTSSFFGKGKKSAWEALKSYPEARKAFLYIHNHPFAPVDSASQLFAHLERLTIILYDKTSQQEKVNEARRELFSKKGRSLENIPPTQDALLLHVKRTIYQSGIWSTCHNEMPDISTPDNWGWRFSDSMWQPLWMTLPEASKVCTELIKCSCKPKNGCTRCKCVRSGLTCTDLCKCKCQK